MKLFLLDAASTGLTAGDKVALTIAIGVFFIPVVILTLYVCIKKMIDVAKRNHQASLINKEVMEKEKEEKRLEKEKQKENLEAVKQAKIEADLEEKRQNQTFLEIFGGKKNIQNVKVEEGKVILELVDAKKVDLPLLRDKQINITKSGNLIKSNSSELIEFFSKF